MAARTRLVLTLLVATTAWRTAHGEPHARPKADVSAFRDEMLRASPFISTIPFPSLVFPPPRNRTALGAVRVLVRSQHAGDERCRGMAADAASTLEKLGPHVHATVGGGVHAQLELACERPTQQPRHQPVAANAGGEARWVEGVAREVDGSELCAASNQAAADRFAPQCFQLPKQANALGEAVQGQEGDGESRWVAWEGRKARLVAGEAALSANGAVFRYLDQPLLYDAYKEAVDTRKDVRAKLSVRVFGVVTGWFPLRLHVSRHGFYSVGSLEENFSLLKFSDSEPASRAMHLVDVNEQIVSGNFIPASMYENDYASVGSLTKFLTQLLPEGMDAQQWWQRLQPKLVSLVSSVHAADIQQAQVQHGACQEAMGGGDCQVRRFQLFSVDVGVEQNGEPWVLEYMPESTLIPPPADTSEDARVKRKELLCEGGYDVIITREVRQAAWSSYVLALARAIDKPFLHVLDTWLSRASKPPRDHDRQVLTDMAMEHRLLCVLGMEPVLPVHWKSNEDTLRRALGDDGLELYGQFDALRLAEVADAFGLEHCDTGLVWRL